MNFPYIETDPFLSSFEGDNSNFSNFEGNDYSDFGIGDLLGGLAKKVLKKGTVLGDAIGATGVKKKKSTEPKETEKAVAIAPTPAPIVEEKKTPEPTTPVKKSNMILWVILIVVIFFLIYWFMIRNPKK